MNIYVYRNTQEPTFKLFFMTLVSEVVTSRKKKNNNLISFNAHTIYLIYGYYLIYKMFKNIHSLIIL